MAYEMKYLPNDIPEPWKDNSCFFPFDGAFENRKWGMVASYFVSASKRKGSWVTLLDFTSDYDTKGMIKAGYLKRVGRRGVKLTEKAIESLAQYTTPEEKALMGKSCEKIIEIMSDGKITEMTSKDTQKSTSPIFMSPLPHHRKI